MADIVRVELPRILFMMSDFASSIQIEPFCRLFSPGMNLAEEPHIANSNNGGALSMPAHNDPGCRKLLQLMG